MDFVKFLPKLMLVISGITSVINKIKSAGEGEKRAAIYESVLESVSLAEFILEKDVLNDPNVKSLLDAVIAAESAVGKARDALKAGILTAKAAQPPVV